MIGRGIGRLLCSQIITGKVDDLAGFVLLPITQDGQPEIGAMRGPRALLWSLGEAVFRWLSEAICCLLASVLGGH